MDGDRSRPMSSGRTSERRPTEDRWDWHGTHASAAAADDRTPDAGGGHSTRPGAVRSSRGQPTRTGTGFPSPTASNVPARGDMSPPARSAPTRAVGPDHEWGTHTDRPLRRTSADRHASPSNHHGPAIGGNKRPRTSGAGPQE